MLSVILKLDNRLNKNILKSKTWKVISIDFIDDSIDDIGKINSEVSNSIKKRIALLKEQKRDYEKEINTINQQIKELKEERNEFLLKKIGE